MTAIATVWDALQRPPGSWLLRFALAGGLIALVAVFVDFSAAVRALGDADPLLFAAALGLAIGAWAVNSFKWWLLLRPLDPEPGPLRLFEWNLRGIFYGQLLPGMLAGEAVKGYRLYRQTGTAAPVFVSIGADRLTGLVALALLGSLALVRSPDLRGDPLYIGAVIGLGLLVPAVLLALFTPYGSSWVRRLQRLPGLGSIAHQGADVVEEYEGRYLLLAVTLALALAFQSVGAVTVYLLARSINLDVGIVDFLWVYAAVSLVTLLPIAFGGLGAREGAFILLLGPLDVASEAAVTLGLLVMGMQLGTALLGGGLELKSLLWPAARPALPVAPGLALQSEGAKDAQ